MKDSLKRFNCHSSKIQSLRTFDTKAFRYFDISSRFRFAGELTVVGKQLLLKEEKMTMSRNSLVLGKAIRMKLFVLIGLCFISITQSYFSHKSHLLQIRKVEKQVQRNALKIDDLLQKSFSATNIASLSASTGILPGREIWNRVRNLFQRKSDNTTAITPTSNTTIERDIVIVGAGVAGLTCLRTLTSTLSTSASPYSLLLLEQADRVGGRIFTENIDGFLLDNGFQVFIDQYPNSLQVFNYSSLRLKKFSPGALVHTNNQFYSVYDPFRMPQKLLDSLFNPIGSILDKVIVGLMTIFIRARPLSEIYSGGDITTKEFLTTVQGLSDSMVDSFFRAFYQGIFLSPLELQSSRLFQFIFKMFAEGSACLPAKGMGEIPKQLASSCPSDAILLNQRVTKIRNLNDKYLISSIDTNTGKKIRVIANSIVLACDPISASKLLSDSKKAQDFTIPEGRGSTCLYFSLDGSPPIKDPVLILNGENRLTVEDFTQKLDEKTIDYQDVRINNVCFPNMISPAYSPPGKSLASVTIVGYLPKEKISDERLETLVRFQLEDWWGKSLIEPWKLLKIYRIPYAQPRQMIPMPLASLKKKNFEIAKNIYVIGDYQANPTLNGAIETGLEVANLFIERKKKKKYEEEYDSIVNNNNNK